MKTTRVFPATYLLALAISLFIPLLQGQTYDFTFAEADQFGNTNWNADGNWTGSGFPAAAGTIGNVSDANFGTGSSYAIRFQGDFNDSTVGILNIDLQQSNSGIRFTGGAGSRFLTFSGTIDNPAALNVSGAGRVDTTRRFNFATDTTVSVTGGKFEFNGGAITGTGNLSFTGGGGVTEITTVTTTGTVYSGNISISSGALVYVNGMLEAHTTLARTVTVGSTGTLRGTGTIGRATTIESGGTLAPGNSPGILTFSEGLTFDDGANFNFALIANSTATRGTNFSGIDVTGGTLSINPAAVFNMDFSVGSVDFTDVFWTGNQSWLVFENALSPDLGGDIFTLGTISNDSFNQSFDLTGGTFSFQQTGNDVLLLYTIPEASTAALFLGLAAAFAVLQMRRRRNG